MRLSQFRATVDTLEATEDTSARLRDPILVRRRLNFDLWRFRIIRHAVKGLGPGSGPAGAEDTSFVLQPCLIITHNRRVRHRELGNGASTDRNCSRCTQIRPGARKRNKADSFRCLVYGTTKPLSAHSLGSFLIQDNGGCRNTTLYRALPCYQELISASLQRRGPCYM